MTAAHPDSPPGSPGARRSALGVTYEHPVAFWAGVAAVIVGTLMQLPMYFDAKDMGYRLRGMPFDGTMLVGAVQYGFQQWIPSNLQKLGYNEVNASKILRDSALIGFPLNLPIALLYGFWSSRKTIIIMGVLTAAALLGFVVGGDAIADNSTLLHLLLVVPIWGISSLTAVTAAYASEIYPTRIRARGTGLAAAGTKLGGVLILAAVAAALAAPSIAVTALLGAVPIVAAVALLIFFGVETRRKGLEQITAEELGTPVAAAG